MGERTLRWWSSALRRGTRAQRGSHEATAIAAIEIEVPRNAERAGQVEIAIDGAVLRVEIGADVEYVAALARQLRGSR